MKIALIQCKQNALFDYNNPPRYTLAQIIPMQREMIDQNLSLLEECIDLRCDLIVTSEAINSCGFTEALDGDCKELIRQGQDALLSQFSEIAKRAGAWLVAGINRVENGVQYNSAVIYDRTGKLLDIYDKIQLAAGEQKTTRAGNRLVHFDAEFGRVGVCICWDMQFPELCRAYAAAGCRMAVCPTWGWEKIYGHARAYENGIYVAAAMAVPFPENIGEVDSLRTPSQLVAPDGRVVATARCDKAQVLYARADLNEGTELWKERLADRRPALYCREYPWGEQ